MTDRIKLALYPKDDRTELEIRVLHPMDPGDVTPQKTGRARPPSFLQSMVIQLNEKILIEGQLSASLSKNPRFGFWFSGVKAGDKFTVSCADIDGAEFNSEIVAKS